MFPAVFLLLLSLLSSPKQETSIVGTASLARKVTLWNQTGVVITICLKNKVNCYEGHPCCNWQAYRWIGVDKSLVIDLSTGDILNFRYNKANGDICAAGTVEFVLADNPGQKSDVYLR